MQKLILVISETVERFTLNKKDLAVIFAIAVVGLFLRLYPGQDHFIWSYDQARDSVVIRTILGEKNIMIAGPQTEFVGLNHGPLYYYIAAPFYHYAQANPNIVLYAMAVLNLSTLIPLTLLVQHLFRDSRITIVSAVLFAVAYQQIEYARWLSNVSVAIPMLAWSYFFLWKTVSENKRALFTGLFAGLAMQAEFFLVFMVAIAYLLFYFYGVTRKSVIKYHLGFALGACTYIISEIKFNFLGVKTFVTEFLAGHSDSITPASLSLTKYLDHLGFTTQQNVFGITPAMGLLAFFGLLGVLLAYRHQIQRNNYTSAVVFLLVLLFSHSILVTFHFIDAVFLNLTFLVPLLVLTAFVIWLLYTRGHKWFSFALVALILGTQLYQLHSNVQAQTPFKLYNFHQSAILFSEKKEIVAKVYELTNGEEFTFGVLGTPYGVQTVWATLFENYLAEHPNLTRPHWYGYQALGYPADTYFTKVDHPAQKHILIIEDNSTGVLNEVIIGEYMATVNESTTVIDQTNLYGYTIQVREPKQVFAVIEETTVESEN